MPPRLGLTCIFALGLATACASSSAPPQRPRPGQGLPIDWDDPRQLAALENLLQLAHRQAELQSRAAQELAAQGVPSATVILARDEDPSVDEALRAMAPARCARSQGWLLCARSLIEGPPLPLRLRPGDSLNLHFRLLGSTRFDRLLHQTPNDAVIEIDAQVRDRDLRAELGPLTPGLHVVELMVRTQRGVEVAALWQVAVGDDAQVRLLVDTSDPADGDAQQATQRYVQLVQDSRRRAGLPRLRWSPALAQAAREHARRLAAQGRLVHHSSEQLGQLLDDKGARFAWVGENLARARSVRGANSVILASPSHVLIRLAPQAEVIGLAAIWRPVEGRRELFVVNLLAQTFEASDPETMARLVERHIHALRQGQGLAPLRLDPRLRELATSAATDTCLGMDPAGVERISQRALRRLGDLSEVGAVISRLARAQDLEPTPALLASSYELLGAGAQRCSPQGPFAVIVLVARQGGAREP